MKHHYSSKLPAKQILLSSILILSILFYIFGELVHYLIIISFSVLSSYFISITLMPIFEITEQQFIRTYFFRLFKRKYFYELNNIEKIEVRDKREGYQAFPTMKIFFTKNDEEQTHLFHFIKESKNDFEGLVKSMLDKNINIVLLSGN